MTPWVLVIDGVPGVTHWAEFLIVGAGLVGSMAAAIPVLWRWLFAQHVENLIRRTIAPTARAAVETRNELREVHGTLTRNGYTNDPPTLLDLVHDIQRQASVNQRLLMDHLEHSEETLAVVLPALAQTGALPVEVVEQLRGAQHDHPAT